MPDPDPPAPVALIAGGGGLPRVLAEAARRSGRGVLVVRLEGEADDAFTDFDRETVRYGQVGRFLAALEGAGCKDVVMAGSVSRPSFDALRPDLGGIRLLPRIAKVLIGGDDSVLRKMTDLMEEEGLRLISPLDIAPDLGVPEGLLAGTAFDDAACRAAIGTARTLGTMDAGQAVVVDGGRAIALEGLEGTDGMLRRAADLRTSGRWQGRAPSGVFAKAAKPQQDMRLDVPTVGMTTLDGAIAARLSTVALEAGRVLLMDRDRFLRRAREAGIAVVGVAP